jgi:nicotinamide mononucleotide adenylyltransferase
MRLKELFEDQATQIAVILPGRFQPPHPGHLHGYLELVEKFGSNNVYISMTEKTDPEESPFSYDERKEIFTKLLGVPSNKIIKVVRQYNVKELVKVLDLNNNSAIIFAISQKDSADERFSMAGKKDGSESYMKKFKSDEYLDSYMKHSYVVEYPTTRFKINGKNLNSAGQLRNLFRSLPIKNKKLLFKEIYGVFDERIFKLFLDKFSN